MLPSRSKMSFEESAKLLFRRNPHVYFWTFTFVKVPWCDTWALQQWAKLRKKICQHFAFVEGLRVTELHKSHGIHFHVIVNERISIDYMHRIGKPLGFGRISVKEADVDSVTYLSKYLTKEYMDKNKSFAGRRRWGVIGCLPATRCKDLVYDTPYIRNRKLYFGKTQMRYNVHAALSSYSHAFGDVKDWPLRVKIAMQVMIQQYENKKIRPIL